MVVWGGGGGGGSGRGPYIVGQESESWGPCRGSFGVSALPGCYVCLSGTCKEQLFISFLFLFFSFLSTRARKDTDGATLLALSLRTLIKLSLRVCMLAISFDTFVIYTSI